MRLLSAITLTLAPVAGFAAQDITKDETVRGFVTTSVIAAKVANGCDKLTISSAGLTVPVIASTTGIESAVAARGTSLLMKSTMATTSVAMAIPA